MMPDALPVALLRCEDFRNEPAVIRLKIAEMLWQAMHPARAHRQHPGMASFSDAAIKSIWGTSALMRRTLVGKHFVVFKGNNLGAPEDRFTAAFGPAEDMLAVAVDLLHDARPVAFVDVAGKRIEMFREAINPFRAGTRTASTWRGLRPANAIPIDVDSLLTLRPHVTPLAALQVDLLVRYARNVSRPGCVPQRYVEHGTGRLFTDGTPISMQNVKRIVRSAALVGRWDCDIENCHFAIFAQLVRRTGARAAATEEYLLSKRETRERIATAAGVSVRDVKSCLIAVMFGARSAVGDYIDAQGNVRKPALQKLLGADAARQLLALPEFAGIARDVRTYLPAVVNAHRIQGGWIVNPLGIRARARRSPDDREGKSDAQLLAHVLQGYEAQALEAVVREYGEDVLLCMHDGWVARHRMDLNRLEQIVFDATGLRLGIEEQRLTHPVVNGRLHSEFEDDEIENLVSDQWFASGDENLFTASSPLQGWPLCVLRERKRTGLVLTLRPDWNFRAD